MISVYFFDQPGQRPIRPKYPAIWAVAEKVVVLTCRALLGEEFSGQSFLPRSICFKTYSNLVRLVGRSLRKEGLSLKDLPDVSFTLEMSKVSLEDSEQGNQ